jgi:hypothetical protein
VGSSQPPQARGPGAGNQPASLGPADNGPGNDHGQGIENAPAASLHPSGSPFAGGLSGLGALPSEPASEASALGGVAGTLLADEPSALGAFADAGGLADAFRAALGNGSPSGPVDENASPIAYTASGNSSLGGMPLLIAPSATTSGAYSALVFGLAEPSSADGFKNPANYPPINNLDSLFLELWDDDQMLFPDTLPSFDEMLFPEVMPKLDDMPSLNESPPGDDFFMDLGRRSQAPIAAPAAVGMADAPAFAAPATVPSDAAGIPSLIVISSPTVDAPATAASDVHRVALISQPVPANDWQEGASVASDSATGPEAGDNLRPYHLALGMIPCLAAFGYTPSSLREHVRAGRRAWKQLRDYVRRKP